MILLLVLTMVVLTGCQLPERDQEQPPFPAVYQYRQLHLGVQVRITLYAEKEENAKAAASAAFSRIAALEDVFSNYRSHSELSTLTTSAYNQPVNVSDPLFALLEASLAFTAETDGAFDITLGPLTALWRSSRKSGKLPKKEAIAEARAQSGAHLVSLDATQHTITLHAPHMQLDPGGIAKGYILDEALQILNQFGIQSALIEAGGDLVVSHPPPGKAGWTIAVPHAPDSSVIAKRAASLSNAALATSGDTEQFVDIAGRRYAHIINPETGLGSTTRRMATVIAEKGMTADKFATALTVMDSTAASTLLSRHSSILAFITHSDDTSASE